LNYRSYNPYN